MSPLSGYEEALTVAMRKEQGQRALHSPFRLARPKERVERHLSRVVELDTVATCEIRSAWNRCGLERTSPN